MLELVLCLIVPFLGICELARISCTNKTAKYKLPRFCYMQNLCIKSDHLKSLHKLTPRSRSLSIKFGRGYFIDDIYAFTSLKKLDLWQIGHYAPTSIQKYVPDLCFLRIDIEMSDFKSTMQNCPNLQCLHIFINSNCDFFLNEIHLVSQKHEKLKCVHVFVDPEKKCASIGKIHVESYFHFDKFQCEHMKMNQEN
jgi:hypothetical protein